MGREVQAEVLTPKSRQENSEISKRLVSDLMLAALRQGNTDFLQLFGFKPVHVALIRNLRLRDQNRLQQLYKNCLKDIHIEVDSAQLETTLGRLIEIDKEEELIDRMIELGAGQLVMRELCGLSHKQTVARRRGLGTEVNSGRPRKPEIEIQFGIAMQWTELAKVEPDPKKRIIRLAESTELSISTIWAILREQDVPIEAPRGSSNGKVFLENDDPRATASRHAGLSTSIHAVSN